MAKYDPLREYLARSSAAVEMTFEEISALVGGLPPTAYRRNEWWANNANRHVQANAWLDGGRRVQRVDLTAQRVSFS